MAACLLGQNGFRASAVDCIVTSCSPASAKGVQRNTGGLYALLFSAWITAYQAVGWSVVSHPKAPEGALSDSQMAVGSEMQRSRFSHFV